MSAFSGGSAPKTETRYALLVKLPAGERLVRSCGSMTEAILLRFECEAACVRGGFACPPLRIEMRAEVCR